MLKLVFTTSILFTISFGRNLALNAENYADYIVELSHDETFLNEYTKWSLELFSQPDYLYGNPHTQFPCPLEKTKDDNHSIPKSVHSLRPSDIRCVAALGDGLTAGLGARAITPDGLLIENRGISWSIGGDYTYSKILSLPNILRQYNPDLKGFSTQVSVMLPNGQSATNNQLNTAKAGDRSIHIPEQARFLIDRMLKETVCDWNNDWKLITIFVGINDLCSFCENESTSDATPEQYQANIRNTLDIFYSRFPIPRTLVNLVLVPDVRHVKELVGGNYVCQVLHKKICPCSTFSTVEQAKTFENYTKQYQQVLVDLIDSGRYQGRDDFTVVIQPFLAQSQLPYKDLDYVDFSYFAPDCLHFSGKGHSQAALSLWNNMLEPVGGKQWSWHINEQFKCPTTKYPYIFTSQNSAQALKDLKSTTVASTTNLVSTVDSSSQSLSNTDVTSKQHHKHGKNHISYSDKSFSRTKLIAIVAFSFIVVIILGVGIARRRKAREFLPGPVQRNFGANIYSGDGDEVDEEELWHRPDIKISHFQNEKTTKSHGTRISFE